MYEFFYCASEIEEVYRRAVISCDLEKLELFGTDYLFEYIADFLKGIQYRNYVSNGIKALIEITAAVHGTKINYPEYAEISNVEVHEKLEKTAEEIIEEVTRNAGLTVI